MDKLFFEKILQNGEGITVEFKSWIKASGMKERIQLAVDELVAFANAKGGSVFFGVEDNGEVTGCEDIDEQVFIEGIYDKTRPPLFTEFEQLEYEGKKIIILTVQRDGTTYATTDGRCLKRLGKNTKPFYPEEMSGKYKLSQTKDFSNYILEESTIDDIDILEIYKLKEKLRIRDRESTLPDLENMAFLRDLGLIREERGIEKLTIAGLLFVGKENSIRRLLPQAEVIYLHYGEGDQEEYDARLDLRQPIITMLDRLSEKIQNNNKILSVQIGLFRIEIADFSEKVFQEALLNALSHRDYQAMGTVYVRHYKNKIVIENPGGFVEGITENNIITHPSVPRNKLIAETLQRLKYVQRTGQGVDIIFREMVSMGKPYPQYRAYDDSVVLTLEKTTEDIAYVKFIVQEQERIQKIFSLSQLMVIRYLAQNKRIKLSQMAALTQSSIEDAKRNCVELMKLAIIELVGKEYMLTARVYAAIKPDIEYVQDRAVRYIRAKEMILEYLCKNEFISNEKIQMLCGYTRQQARTTAEKMRKEGLIELTGKGRGAKYMRRNV